MESNPFADLRIDDYSILETVDSRRDCPGCNRSRKYYCYSCHTPLPAIADIIPKINLPLKVDIIKHPNEVDGKTTGIHAALVAPNDVTVYTFPCIPKWEDRSKVLLVFPCETSVSVEELTKNTLKTKEVRGQISPDVYEMTACSETDHKRNKKQKLEPSDEKSVGAGLDESLDAKFERVVFIESTWNQTKKIYSDERLQGLTCVELKQYKTKFWRHQRGKPDTYLATIEAIYYFFREYHENFVRTEYRGQYDNLLFFYCFMYNKIRHVYEGGADLKAYKNVVEYT